MVLPDMSGLEVCRQIKTDPAHQSTFMVLLSEPDIPDEVQATGFQLGIDGFVVKGIPEREFLARIRAMVQQRQSTLELEERLRFETLLTDISTRFVNLPADRIDGEIVDAQRRVCECLGLELSAVWQRSVETPDFVTLTHLYRPLGGPPQPERMGAKEYFPWCLQQLTAGKVIAVSTAEAPAEAARDQEVWRHYGIKSILAFPLSAGGEPLIGALSFSTVREERAWPEALVKRLQLVAEIFTHALNRKRSDEILRESETRLSLASNAAGRGCGAWRLTPVESGFRKRLGSSFLLPRMKNCTMKASSR